MKVIIQRRGGGTCTLEEFADRHRLTVTVQERRRDMGSAMRFYALFDHVDVADGGMLIGSYGNGSTPDLAIAAYARAIEGKRLKFDDGVRSEYFECPNEFAPARPVTQEVRPCPNPAVPVQIDKAPPPGMEAHAGGGDDRDGAVRS